MTKLQGQLLSPCYLDQLAGQLDGELRSAGTIVVGDICRSHDLPGDFVLAHVVPRLNGTLNSAQDAIMTDAHLRRLSARLRGFLSSATAPLSLAPFFKTAQIDEVIYFSVNYYAKLVYQITYHNLSIL